MFVFFNYQISSEFKYFNCLNYKYVQYMKSLCVYSL